MILPLILELRKRKVPIGIQEVIALARALADGLHKNSFEQFYYISRALLVHDESHFDEFDQVFSYVYRGVPLAAKSIVDDLDEWLKDPRERPDLTDEEKSKLKALDLEELKRLFEERLREQAERHDGGSYWIGSGGTSPFGVNGYHPTGISLRPGGRSALKSADARRYRSYRSDIILDVRQLEMALRRLRSFGRDGPANELDLERSIEETARNFGELELVFRKPRRPSTRVILMMDVGGSMDPFAKLVSQLFSAAKRATHWRELRTYYFHNCIYGKIYRTEGLKEPLSVRDLLRECDSRYKLIFVGDASMAPYELLGWDDSSDLESSTGGLQWLAILRRHFPKSIWLNPDDIPSWRGGESTVGIISKVFPMFPLTLNGLNEGLRRLST